MSALLAWHLGLLALACVALFGIVWLLDRRAGKSAPSYEVDSESPEDSSQ